MASLADALESDPQLRRKQLRELVSSLSPADIRQLADEISKLDSRTDIIARLPIELRLLVAKNFDATDLHTLLGVSKNWRHLWLGEDSVKPLASRFIPGFLEHTRLQAEIEGRPLDLATSFIKAARELHLRNLGKFQSLVERPIWKHMPLDPHIHHHVDNDVKDTLELIDRPYPEFEDPNDESGWASKLRSKFSNGRIAWQVPDHSDRIIVDDLTTQRRKIFVAPLEPGELDLRWAPSCSAVLGDKLVAYQIARKIYVWDLGTGELDRLTLHAAPSRVKVYGNRLCLVFGSSNEVILWSFKGGAVTLQVPAMRHDESTRQPPAGRITEVIFHPLVENTVFVVDNLGGASDLFIFEFTAGILEQTHIFNVASMTHRHAICEHGHIDDDVWHIGREVGPYGEYCVGALSLNPGCGATCPTLSCPPSQDVFCMAIFNVYTSVLTVKAFYHPRNISMNVVWSGQDVFLVSKADIAATAPVVDGEPVSVQRVREATYMDTFVIATNEILPSSELVPIPDSMKSVLQARYCLSADIPPAYTRGRRYLSDAHRPEYLFVDRDSIALASAVSFRVWSFSTDFGQPGLKDNNQALEDSN